MDEADLLNDSHTVDDINYRKLKEKLTKVGYADGISAGRDGAFQLGFDQGYADGLRTGLQLEKVKSFFANLDIKQVDEVTVAEKRIYDGLPIAEATSKDHFKYLNYKDDSLDEITEKQQEYLTKLKMQYVEKLPTTMRLLNNL